MARHFGINPTCTRTNLDGDTLQNIEIAYATLMGSIFSTLRWYRPTGKVRPDEPIGRPREFAEIDLVAQRHAARVNAEYFTAAAFIGHPDDNLLCGGAGNRQ